MSKTPYCLVEAKNQGMEDNRPALFSETGTQYIVIWKSSHQRPGCPPPSHVEECAQKHDFPAVAVLWSLEYL